MVRIVTVRVDLYTKLCLSAIALLLTVLVVGLWAGAPLQTSAQAGTGDPLVVGAPRDTGEGIPDAGAQRMATVNGIRDTNQRLDKIISLLEGGKLRVTAVVEKGAGNGSGE